MIDPIHEQLSAFLDGELSAAESELLLKRIERDAELKVLLERYVLAGEALRATAVQARPSRDFVARVTAAIDSESAPSRSRWQATQWLKPVAGGAIAAGVAAVALVSFQIAPMQAARHLPQDAADQPASGSLVASNADLAAQAGANQNPNQKNTQLGDTAGSASYIVPLPTQARTAPLIQVINNGRLANFVVAHSEYSSPLGRRNVLTGLVAEDLPVGQPVEQFIVEQLAGDEVTPAPQPAKADGTNRRMLSRGPR